MILRLIQGVSANYASCYIACALHGRVLSELALPCRGPSMKAIPPADVVLFEGILVLYDPAIRQLMHMKLFVDTDSDTRLARRGKTMCSMH